MYQGRNLINMAPCKQGPEQIHTTDQILYNTAGTMLHNGIFRELRQQIADLELQVKTGTINRCKQPGLHAVFEVPQDLRSLLTWLCVLETS
jgi:hypothetical protein